MKKILELNTGLFPDAQTVTAALRRMETTHQVVCIDLRHQILDDRVCDQTVAAILSSDLIITV